MTSPYPRRSALFALVLLGSLPILAAEPPGDLWQVTTLPTLFMPEFTHPRSSLAAPGGSCEFFAAQIFSVFAGILKGIPSIDIWVVTCQGSPGGSAARIGSEPSRTQANSAERRGYGEAMTLPPDS